MCEVKESCGYLSTRSGTRYIVTTNCSTDFENDSSDTKVADRLDQSDRWVKWKSKDNHNFGKDEYVVDMTGHEAQY
jgi:hypothetical protein